MLQVYILNVSDVLELCCKCFIRMLQKYIGMLHMLQWAIYGHAARARWPGPKPGVLARHEHDPTQWPPKIRCDEWKRKYFRFTWKVNTPIKKLEWATKLSFQTVCPQTFQICEMRRCYLQAFGVPPAWAYIAK
jgi:hypothetical protein